MFEISEGLREQTINIINDLVDDIAPGYLSPNQFYVFDYENAIYEKVYKFLSDELGVRRFENVYYRDEIFNLLRDVPSERFYNAIEYLLKEMYRIVHIQITISDNIMLNPGAGNEQWSRKASMRDRHISRFKGAVDMLNHRLFQNNAKYRYDLGSGFVQVVRLDTGSDVPEGHHSIQEPNDNQPPEHHQNQGNSEIQEPNDNQIQEHHQNQNRPEFWNKRNFIIGVIALIVIILDFAFGNSILIHLWNHLPTLKEKIAGWFR